jgi:hypothetical protein
MRNSRITTEQVLWILVVTLALGIRMLNLGAEPLSDPEANWALQALSIFPGTAHIEPIPPGTQVSYLAMTGMLFGVLGSNEFLARFLPALAGGLLCLVPYFFRQRLGSKAALIMGFALALDPGLVAISRQAGGPMPALTLVLFALAFLATGRVILAGVLFGLALMSGPASLQGILILLITAGVVWLSEKSEFIAPLGLEEDPQGRLFPPLSSWNTGFLATLATILLAGTLFSLFPQGLGAWLGALPAYFSGWVTLPAIPAGRLLAALLFYQPIGVIFGAVGAVRSWFDRNPFAQRLTIWFVTALVIILIYPGRQVSDLVWALIPLWGLASIELARYLDVEPQQRIVAFGQALLIFVLMALFWLNLAAMSQPVLDQRAYTLRLGVLLGVSLLAVVTTLLLGFGWSWQAASRGLVWGVVAALGLYQMAGMWNSSFTSSIQRFRVWDPAPQSGQADLLMQTISDLSTWTTGRKEYIEVVSAVDAPSLRWLFRNFPNASFVSTEAIDVPGESPAIIITQTSEQTPSLSAAYRGQDFAWWRYPGWETSIPPGLPIFAAYRQFPARQDQLILWARSDLFPGGDQPPAGQSIPSVEPENQGFGNQP